MPGAQGRRTCLDEIKRLLWFSDPTGRFDGAPAAAELTQLSDLVR